jgi:N4-gp56 family major capsid protein
MAVGRKADYTAQVPAIWAKDLYAQAEKLTFWNRFEGGEGSSMPIVRKDDLSQGPGDTIKYDISLALTGAGTTGDTTLSEGNEEEVKMRQISLIVGAIKHAVRWSFLAENQITHDMRGIGLNKLKRWLAGAIDNRNFYELTGGDVAAIGTTGLTATTLPTTAKWFAGTATSIGTVADSDAVGRLKLGDISDFKAYLQTNNLIEPLSMENGDEMFGLVVHPYTALALKKDSSYQQAQREAQVRGADNPLFRGAVASWDGVTIYVSTRVPSATDGAASARVGRNVFFGAQAMCRGYSLYPQWVEQEFSYGEEIGIATRTVLGEKLNAFDLSAAGGASAADFTAIGSGVLYAAAVAPTA